MLGVFEAVRVLAFMSDEKLPSESLVVKFLCELDCTTMRGSVVVSASYGSRRFREVRFAARSAVGSRRRSAPASRRRVKRLSQRATRGSNGAARNA